MKTWIRLFVVMLVVLLFAASISAQPEPCGTLPGLDCTPTPQQGQVADRDGDGVADFVDLCPDQVGTGFTNGCPDTTQGGTPTATAPGALTAPLDFPLSGECLIGNFGNVNVRVEPDTASDILMVLTPGSFLWALYIVINDMGESWYYTLVDGYVRTDVVQNNGNCDDLNTIHIFDITSQPDDPNAAIFSELQGIASPTGADPEAPPPPDPGCFYWIIYEGQVVCLLREELNLTADLPGTGDAPPPDDLFCEYEVVIDGNTICIIDDAVDLAGLGVDPAAIPPVGEPETCYRLVINYETGQAYCLVTIPPVFTTEGEDPNAAPPPDDPTCYYWVVYMGSAICLVSIEPNFAIDTGGGEPLPQTREHILLARQVGVPADCDLYPGSHALYQDITIPPTVQDAMGDPIPTEGCAFELILQTQDSTADPDRGRHIEVLSYAIWNSHFVEDPADFVLLLPASEGEPLHVILCTVPPGDLPMVCNAVNG